MKTLRASEPSDGAERQDLRARGEEGSWRPVGWCRDERLRLGTDHPIGRFNGYFVVRCVSGIHNGTTLAWDSVGEVFAIGSPQWVARKIYGRVR